MMHESGAPNEPTTPEPTDLAMMHRALAQAKLAESIGEVPIGAVIWDLTTGDILAEAHNRREIDADPAGHAELLAIRAACAAIGDWRLNHCGLAVTLEPCPMCAGAIVNARVGRVVYAAADPKAGAVESLYTLLTDDRLNHRCSVVPGVLADDAGTILRAFFRRLRDSKPKHTTG